MGSPSPGLCESRVGIPRPLRPRGPRLNTPVRLPCSEPRVGASTQLLRWEPQVFLRVKTARRFCPPGQLSYPASDPASADDPQRLCPACGDKMTPKPLNWRW